VKIEINLYAVFFNALPVVFVFMAAVYVQRKPLSDRRVHKI